MSVGSGLRRTGTTRITFLVGQTLGSHDANGWLGGAQVGCNYQVGGWVFGIQGDYAWTDASGSSASC